jgi:hypothetical protein
MASPVKAGLRPPPSAAGGLDRACHPAIVCHQEFDGKERLKCTQVPILRRPTLDRPLCSDQACIDRLAPGLGYDSRAERRAKFRCSEWQTRRVRLAALRWCRRSSASCVFCTAKKRTHSLCRQGAMLTRNAAPKCALQGRRRHPRARAPVAARHLRDRAPVERRRSMRRAQPAPQSRSQACSTLDTPGFVRSRLWTASGTLSRTVTHRRVDRRYS